MSRARPKKADYILYINANHPIAIVEAKDNRHAVGDGLQQAMTYAQMMDVPFAYSSNGDAFREHDFITGQERDIPLEDFPSPQQLYARFKLGDQRRKRLNPPGGSHYPATVPFQPDHLSAHDIISAWP